MAFKSSIHQSVTSQVGDLSQCLRRSFNRYIRSAGLTYPQSRVIGTLSKEQGIKQAALAERMDMQPIALARLIDRMEVAGWVERRPDPIDRRAVQLFLTTKAQPILREIRDARADFEKAVLAGISDAEQDQLRRLLGKIRVNVDVVDSDERPTKRSKTK